MFVKFLAFFRRAEVSEKRAVTQEIRKKETPKIRSCTAGYLTGDQHANSDVKYPPSNKLLFYLLIGVKYMKKEREDYGIVLILSTPLPSSP